MHSSESAQAAWGCLHLEHRCEVGCSGEKKSKRPLISFGHRRRERHYYQISLFFSIGFRHWNLCLKSGRYSYKANLFKREYLNVWVTSVSIIPGQLSSLSPVFFFSFPKRCNFNIGMINAWVSTQSLQGPGEARDEGLNPPRLRRTEIWSLSCFFLPVRY